MTLDEFLALSTPPDGLHPALCALLAERRGDWDEAHQIVQDEDDADSAWVHAYLHHKEGDSGNALYWYVRAGKAKPHTSSDSEWREIAIALLSEHT
jgi:hypothetical protein